MDSGRYLRIALPPFVFYGAVILAHALNNTLVSTIKDWGGSAGLVAAIVGASIVPLGYVIGGVTLLFLRSIGRDDVRYSEDDLAPLFTELNISNPTGYGFDARFERLNAARTFVFESREKWWVGEHVNRLWEASIAYTGSVFALLLSIPYVCYSDNYKCWLWWVIVVVAIVACVLMSCYTRVQIKKIVTFQITNRASIKAAAERWRLSTSADRSQTADPLTRDR